MSGEKKIRSVKELVDEICVFMECAIHNILYTRDVYPSGSFHKVKIYNVPVLKCRHPLVASYVKKLVDSLRPLFGSGAVDKVCLVVCADDESKTPIEQYVFSLKIFPSFDRLSKASLETLLRSFLLKINIADSVFAPIECKERTFYILAHTDQGLGEGDQQGMQAGLENPWVGCDEEMERFADCVAAPFKAVITQAFQLQLHVQKVNNDWHIQV